VGFLDFVCGDGLRWLCLLWVLCICCWIMVEEWRFCVADGDLFVFGGSGFDLFVLFLGLICVILWLILGEL
jgi:hypothetical protein